MEELLQQAWSSFLRLGESIIQSVEQGVSYEALQREVEEGLQELGRTVMRLAIEGVDERLREEPKEREGWVVARRDDVKEVLTPFGMMAYRRTYFRHKASGRHRYLADEQVGIGPHQRIDTRLKAQLVERSTECSYRQSGRWNRHHASWRVSGQTVMQAVQDVRTDAWGKRSSPEGRRKRRVPYLFVQADEDHVGSQEGVKWQPRLVTVYEGRKGPAWRQRLVNPRHFGGLYHRRHEALWQEVWRYLDETYDLEHVAAILVCGDGAGWIRAGCEYLPGSTFVLDRYHANQYVTRAAADNRALRRRLWEALKTGKRREMNAVLAQAYGQAETGPRRRAVEDARKYLNRNWDGMVAWRTFADIWPGCSAEGHISHIYAARLSSRPMAWGQKGVDQMSRLRVMRANAESIQETYLAHHAQRLPPLRISERQLRQTRQSLEKSGSLAQMATYNLPGLQGCSPALRRILKSIIQQ